MKKDITMRKNTFIKGAFITSLGIIVSKILGILYVVPFHAVIGDEGGALYGYAYTIYTLFMSLASAGIPLAISKIVSEYQTLGYYNVKKRAFVIGKRISLLLGVVCFCFIFVFSPLLAKSILGNVHGISSIEDVTFVIRVIATAILVVPILSVYRGYFEGHRFMSPPSISQVLEQVIRVFIIIFGSFVALRFFHLSLASSVGIALFGATLGAFASYLYLLIKKMRNKSKFNEKIRKVNEPIISDKTIIMKIIYYAIPFILIDIFKSIYNYVDMVTVVKGLVRFANYRAMDAEVIYSMLSTWAAKFNMIILSISTGIIVSLIPNLTESIVRGNEKEVHKKINQTLGILLYLTIPLTFGISFLAKAIWILFYGSSIYGPSILGYYIFVGLFVGLFTSLVTVLQTLKDYKAVFISLIMGVIVKIIFNYKFIIAFSKMKLPAYYGTITASIFGYLLSFILCLVFLRNKYHVNFEETLKNFIDIMCSSILMILVLFISRFLIPVYSNIRIMNLFIIIAYGIIGMIIYFVYSYKIGLMKRVFDKSSINSLKKLFIRK